MHTVFILPVFNSLKALFLFYHLDFNVAILDNSKIFTAVLFSVYLSSVLSSCCVEPQVVHELQLVDGKRLLAYSRITVYGGI